MNHHHLISAAGQVNGAVMWANLHWLFWMSLIPLMTLWQNRFPFTPGPTVFYGIVLLMCVVSYLILQFTILKTKRKNAPLPVALRKDKKGPLSVASYILGIFISIFAPVVGTAIYWLILLIWVYPDKRLVKAIQDHNASDSEDW